MIDWICPNTQKGEGQVLISASLSVAPGQGIKGLDVVRHGVSLRPARKGGPRVARDVVEGVDVVHNYGHGVFGYQISWGCPGPVVQLVDDVLNNVKARLILSLLPSRILRSIPGQRRPNYDMNTALSCRDRASSVRPVA